MIVDGVVCLLTALLALLFTSRASVSLLIYHSLIFIIVYLFWINLSGWEWFLESFHIWLVLFSVVLLLFLIAFVNGFYVLKLATSFIIFVHIVSILNIFLYDNRYITSKGYRVIYESYPILRLGFVSMQIIGLLIYDDGGIHKRISKLFSWLCSTFGLVFNYNHTHSQSTQRVSK
jgi:hypothetical protein